MLPQYGVLATGPLLVSLRALPSLTKEQRDRLPLILATIGPSTVPALLRHLYDPQEHVRAIAATTLGLLRVLDTVPSLAALARDPSDVVRQSVVEALGRRRRTRESLPQDGGLILGRGSRVRRVAGWFRRKKRGVPVPASHPVGLAVATLGSALCDGAAAVRTQAARRWAGSVCPPRRWPRG